MRGIPGSGKTTWVNQHILSKHPEARIVSADHYFTCYGATAYKFDASKLGKAHFLCFLHFQMYVEFGTEVLVVDNTNIKYKEYEKYVTFAKDHGYEVKEVTLECDPEIAHARCTHGVSLEKIYQKYNEFKKELG